MNVCAIDPGREKCGLAVVNGQGVLFKEVVPTEEIGERLASINCPYDTVIIGNGTNSEGIIKTIRGLLPEDVEGPIPVDEYGTTLEARKRYFVENPPKGIYKLIPLSMQVPGVPYDQYVAVILAERYLKKGISGNYDE